MEGCKNCISLKCSEAWHPYKRPVMTTYHPYPHLMTWNNVCVCLNNLVQNSICDWLNRLVQTSISDWLNRLAQTRGGGWKGVNCFYHTSLSIPQRATLFLQIFSKPTYGMLISQHYLLEIAPIYHFVCQIAMLTLGLECIANIKRTKWICVPGLRWCCLSMHSKSVSACRGHAVSSMGPTLRFWPCCWASGPKWTWRAPTVSRPGYIT